MHLGGALHLLGPPADNTTQGDIRTVSTVTTTTEIRMGRNFIRPGDIVKVQPAPGKRTYLATFKGVVLDDNDDIEYVEVYGAPANKCPAAHYFRLDQISRVAQTRHADRKGVK